MRALFRARTRDLVVETVADEVLIYDLTRHRAHCLGPAAAAVWRACTGRATVREIARRASRQSGLAVDEGLVRLTLRRLERAHLLEGEAPPLPDAGRRELMRRAAALGAFAVASLAAPTPAMAVTCTPCGTCINLRNNQCTGLPCCDGPRAGQGCLSGGGGQFCTCGGAGIRTCT